MSRRAEDGYNSRISAQWISGYFRNAGYHDRVLQQTLPPARFFPKNYSVKDMFKNLGFTHFCNTYVYTAMYSGGYYLIYNGHYYNKK